MKKIVRHLKKIIEQIDSIFILLLQKLIKFIKRLIYAKFDLLGRINKLSNIKIGVFYLITFFVGRILLFYDPISFDLVHQIVLTIISYIVLYSLKYAYNMTEKIRSASLGLVYGNNGIDCTTRTLTIFVDQMIHMQQSIWWPIIMLLPPINFIRKNIYLGFVEKNPAGYYAVIFAATTYYLALLGYVQILIALIQFRKISHDTDECIPLDFPHDTVAPPQWLTLWNELFQKIMRRFFVVGTLFTLEYVLLMPKGIITIDENKKFIFNVNDVNAFLFSWITIVVFIIIAFPLISYIINNMILLTIKNLGKKINREYEISLGSKLSIYSPLDIWAYKQLVESSYTYSNYFKTTKNIIPIVSTLISFLLNAFKLYESILLPMLTH